MSQILGSAIDITERKIKEKRLNESEEKYRSILENIKESYFEVDLKGTYTFFNDAFCELLGEKRDNLMGKNYQGYTNKESKKQIFKIYNEVYKSGNPNSNYQSQFIRSNGEEITCESSVYLRYDSHGNKIGFSGLARNITKNFLLLQKLRGSEERLKKFMESATDGFVLIDSKLNYIDANKVTLQTVGMTKEELIGKSILDLAPNLKGSDRYDKYLEVLKTGEPFSTEDVTFNRLDGSLNSYFSLRAFKVGDDLGIIFTDITESKKAEEEITNLAKYPSENPYPILRVSANKVIYANKSGKYLFDMELNDEIPNILRKEIKKAFESKIIIDFDIKLKKRIYSFTITPIANKNYLNLYGMDITERKHKEENLKEINKLKSEFLRRASHELKTPLISIKGFSDLILSLYADQLDPVIISKLREINDGCERLQNIINNLLKTSRLESPDLKPKVEKEDLSFLIKFCVHELESLAERRNQSIKLAILNDLFANIEKEEIHDVISNLLINAIKYTPPGGKIEINTDLKEDFVVISVKDNGIGFTDEQKKKIFQQFGKIERYGQGLDLGIDGTGLGLYISKRIVESHGGKIWMDSEGKNKGASFYFTLPTIK